MSLSLTSSLVSSAPPLLFITWLQHSINQCFRVGVGIKDVEGFYGESKSESESKKGFFLSRSQSQNIYARLPTTSVAQNSD